MCKGDWKSTPKWAGKRQTTSSEKKGEDNVTSGLLSQESLRPVNDVAATESRTLPPQHQIAPTSPACSTFPGEVRAPGSDWKEDSSRRTIMIGSDEFVQTNHDDHAQFHSLTTDAYVPTNAALSDGLIWPIQTSHIDDETLVKKSYYFEKCCFS